MASSLCSMSQSCLVASTSSRHACPRPNAHAARRAWRVRSTAPGFEKSMMGEDFGARDAYPGEIASNFCEKVLGNYNTDHIIKPPDSISNHLGLLSRDCASASDAPLDEATRERLRQQTPGWRVQGNGLIRQEWTAQNAEAAQQLLARVRAVAQAQQHPLGVADAIGATAVVEVGAASTEGLTERDFILAAHINALDLSDLLKKKMRYWA